jgi:hypothetical protein
LINTRASAVSPGIKIQFHQHLIRNLYFISQNTHQQRPSQRDRPKGTPYAQSSLLAVWLRIFSQRQARPHLFLERQPGNKLGFKILYINEGYSERNV